MRETRGEHPFGDRGQLIFAALFLAVWVGDSFFLHWSTFLKNWVPESIRMGLLGLALLTQGGFQGALFQMIAHGVTSAAMFFLVGVIYDRAHHRDMNRLGGLATQMPVYTGLAIVGFFAGMGLPGLAGFIGEIYVLLGSWQATIIGVLGARVLTVIAASGVILTAGYILWAMQRVYLGQPKPEYADVPEITHREITVMAPMAVLAVALGVFPWQTVFYFVHGTLDNILKLFS